MKNRHTKINRKTMRGAVVVEMAMLMTLLIVMAFSVAEFGRAIYEYNTLTKSVRDAVRHVSQSTPTDKLKSEATNLAIYGSTIDTGQPLLPNLVSDTVNITITDALDAATGIRMVTVTITGYTFDFFFNPLILFGSASTNIPFGDIHATMRQL